MNRTTRKYEAARVKANEASRVFAVAQLAYRARKIGDAEFLAAKSLHDAAQLEFDAAYAEASE